MQRSARGLPVSSFFGKLSKFPGGGQLVERLTRLGSFPCDFVLYVYTHTSTHTHTHVRGAP